MVVLQLLTKLSPPTAHPAYYDDPTPRVYDEVCLGGASGARGWGGRV